MDWTVSSLLTAVGAVGFPIIACVWLAISFKTSIDLNTDSNRKLIESNKAITDVLSQVCSKINIIDTIPKGSAK
jgi:hypothetical protein